MSPSELADLIGVAVAQFHDLLSWHSIDREKNPRLSLMQCVPNSPAENWRAEELDSFTGAPAAHRRALRDLGGIGLNMPSHSTDAVGLLMDAETWLAAKLDGVLSVEERRTIGGARFACEGIRLAIEAAERESHVTYAAVA